MARHVALEKGPNIGTLPLHEPLPERLELPVLLALGDDVSTDEILPAGARVLPFRSNIERIAEFCFNGVDPEYVQRAKGRGRHAIVAGRNYGQGSSREHAALAPRHLGLALVLAQSFARIHRQNLINFGIIPATFGSERDRERVRPGSNLRVERLRDAVTRGSITIETDAGSFQARVELSERERRVLLAGGILEDEVARRQRR
jgi:aconitate hydratase